MNNCDQIIEEYIRWFRKQFAINWDGKACRIKTPFFSPDNDPLKLYASEHGSNIKISDMGYVSDFLFVSGLDPEGTSRRKELFEELLNAKKLTMDGEEIFCICSRDKLGEAIHNTVTGFLSLLDMTYLIETAEERLPFREAVKQFFDQKQVKYHYRFSVKGAAIEHEVDFAFNGNGAKYADTLSPTSRQRARELSKYTAFKFTDIRNIQRNFTSIAVCDDSNDEFWTGDSLRILKEYTDVIIPWSKREELLAQFP